MRDLFSSSRQTTGFMCLLICASFYHGIFQYDISRLNTPFGQRNGLKWMAGQCMPKQAQIGLYQKSVMTVSFPGDQLRRKRLVARKRTPHPNLWTQLAFLGLSTRCYVSGFGLGTFTTILPDWTLVSGRVTRSIWHAEVTY